MLLTLCFCYNTGNGLIPDGRFGSDFRDTTCCRHDLLPTRPVAAQCMWRTAPTTTRYRLRSARQQHLYGARHTIILYHHTENSAGEQPQAHTLQTVRIGHGCRNERARLKTLSGSIFSHISVIDVIHLSHFIILFRLTFNTVKTEAMFENYCAVHSRALSEFRQLFK